MDALQQILEKPILFGFSIEAVMSYFITWLALAVAGLTTTSIATRSDSLADCPGYTASNVRTNANSLTADLGLAGTACDVYGYDLKNLTLKVVYETSEYP